MSEAKTAHVSADWRDSVGMIDSFRAALKKFGIHMYSDPNCKGTDQYGFLLADKVLTEAEVKEATKMP